MINGDYSGSAGASHGGSRADAQSEAAALLEAAKHAANPESTVGILTYGGRAVRLLSSPTDGANEAKLLACLTGALVKPQLGGGGASVQLRSPSLDHQQVESQ